VRHSYARSDQTASSRKTVNGSALTNATLPLHAMASKRMGRVIHGPACNRKPYFGGEGILGLSGQEIRSLLDLALQRVAGAQSGRRRRSEAPSRWCLHSISPNSSNEVDGTICDLRGGEGRRRRGRRRRWRALFEGPLAIVTTDRVAQPSADAP
jgi:hypothetical protein